MEFYKCKECLRVYDSWLIQNAPYDICKCGSKRFKGNCRIYFLLIRRWFTDWKYICFGEKAYEKRS